MSNLIREFRAFIMRGNVLDLAVAVILGAAFGLVAIHAVDLLILNQHAQSVAHEAAVEGADAVPRESASRRHQRENAGAAKRPAQFIFHHPFSPLAFPSGALRWRFGYEAIRAATHKVHLKNNRGNSTAV